MTHTQPIKQLRIVIEAEDHETAAAFFRDTLGMAPLASFSQGADAEVVILDAGRATLELANGPHKRFIDEVEAEGRPSPGIRLAFEVEDSRGMTDRAVAAGAHLVAEPRLTPWQSVNSRLDAPAPGGLQISFFQETLDEDARRGLDGFAE